MCEEHVRRFGWWQRFCLKQVLKFVVRGTVPILYQGSFAPWVYNYDWLLAVQEEAYNDNGDPIQSEVFSALAETETGQE